MGEPGGLPSLGSRRAGHDCSNAAAVWEMQVNCSRRPVLNPTPPPSHTHPGNSAEWHETRASEFSQLRWWESQAVLKPAGFRLTEGCSGQIRLH